MGCTMALRADNVFPQYLIPLSILIFIIYVLSHKIRFNKIILSKVTKFFCSELVIVVLLLLVFSTCANGCETSCPSYYMRPIIKFMIYGAFCIVCSMLLYIRKKGSGL